MTEFTKHGAGPAIRMELLGRLDSAGAEQIEAPLIATIRAGAADTLIDLRQVPFVGSLGIRLLISAHRALQRIGRQMVIFGAAPHVTEVFETVALDEIIKITATESEALAAL